MKKDKNNTNRSVDNKEKRFELRCSFCPPNRGENCKNYKKHGSKKPKYKNKRK